MSFSEFLTLLRRFAGATIALVCGVLTLVFVLNDLAVGAVIFAPLALFGLYLAHRRPRPRMKHQPAATPAPRRRQPEKRDSTRERMPTGLRYEQFRWGQPAPTPRQFGYACALGIPIVNGLTKDALAKLVNAAEDQRDGEIPPTKKQIEHAQALRIPVPEGITKKGLRELIDAAEDEREKAMPATREQLAEIRELHGVLPREITQGEADKVIEFLYEHTLPCPFCGFEINAADDTCCDCNRSLKKLRVPIELD